MKLAAVVLAATVLLSTTAHAADYRLRRINYVADSVTQLNIPIGIALHVVLAPGEEFLTSAMGDPAAWEFAHVGEHYFLKPKAANGDTNLVIVTTKRTYNFWLHVAASTRATTFQLTFAYPGEAAHSKIADLFKARAATYNLSYTGAGDEAIAPMNVWDDGRFTSFKFAENTDLPNVYVVSADGTEKLVNRQMSVENGLVIVAQTVATKFRLRLGDMVLDIFNDGFTAGIPNTTRTSAPNVQRVLKGEPE